MKLTRLGLFIALSLPCLGACDDEGQEPTKGTASAPAVSPAKQLLARLGTGSEFAPQLIAMPENAPLFLSILEEANEERVQLAALHALSKAFARIAVTNPQWSESTIRAALETSEHASPRLEAASNELLANALKLANTHQLAVGLMKKWAGTSRPRQRFSLSAFRSSGASTSPEIRAFALQTATERQDAEACEALRLLGKVDWHKTSKEERARLREALDDEKLAGQSCARGFTLSILASLPQPPASARKLVETRLSDPSPFVRSKACSAAARLGAQDSIPRLAALVHDDADDRLRLVTKNPAGQTLHLVFDGSTENQVRDAAIRALQQLSRGKLRFSPGADLEQQAQVAERWAANAH